MTYPGEHMVLQFGGRVVEGDSVNSPEVEIFSGSMRFAGPGLTQSDRMPVAAALATVLGSYWQNIAANIPSSHWLTFIKWNRVGPDGRYVSQDASRTLNFVSPVQGYLAPRYPLQVCWATTWGTDAVRGKAVRSHTFWPTAVTIQKNSLVSQTDAVNKAAFDDQLLRDLNDAARTGFVDTAKYTVPSWIQAIGLDATATREGSGMSMMVMSKIGSGIARPITHAEVGRRLDVQRRRANDQVDPRVQAG